MKLPPSFQELAPRERLAALLDATPAPQELLGPFDRIFSPWLARQGSVPQADDGVILMRGRIAGQEVVAIAIEPAFEGGSIGEVGGAKIAGALELAAGSAREGQRIGALLLLETGGVRLGEANLGLAAVARIQRAIVELRALAPVVAVIAGPTGCFGGMSLAAELCSHIVGTPYARLGMNGPEVIELEAGPEEIDATDREAIWRMIGCEARLRQGFIDSIAEDRAESIGAAVRFAFERGACPPQRLADPHAALMALRASFPAAADVCLPATTSRGRTWIECLCPGSVRVALDTPSVLLGELMLAGRHVLAVALVPDAASVLPRAAGGQMGLLEGWTIAAVIRAFIARQAVEGTHDPILCVVDSPGQAFGRIEETLCISAACAAAVEAYAEARRAGHPVLTLVVGHAISGSFLAHGLQADSIVALDDAGVTMHAMSAPSIARITRRSLAEVEAAAAGDTPMSYRVAAAHRLGIVQTLLSGMDADQPTLADVACVCDTLSRALSQPVSDAERKIALANNPLRAATMQVDRLLQQQWPACAPQTSMPDQQAQPAHEQIANQEQTADPAHCAL